MNRFRMILRSKRKYEYELNIKNKEIKKLKKQLEDENHTIYYMKDPQAIKTIERLKEKLLDQELENEKLKRQLDEFKYVKGN